MPVKHNPATDAITILEHDHEVVLDLLEQLEKTTERSVKKRGELLERIAHELRTHAKLEEKIFYPAYHGAAKTSEDAKLFFEATEEHGLVDVVLPELERTDATTEVFAAKAKVLKDLVEHHAGEEEDEMFPRAKKLLGKDRLRELGAELEKRRPTILQEDSPASLTRRNGSRPSKKSANKRLASMP